MHLILTTTKFVIQNGINQSCRVNTFWSMNVYVSKLEKGSCMVLPLRDFLSRDSYAPKMADYGLILYIFFIINWSNACQASCWYETDQLKQDLCKVKRINNQWSLVDQYFRPYLTGLVCSVCSPSDCKNLIKDYKIFFF